MFLFPSEVNLDDTLVALHLIERSVTENMALVKDGDLAP